MTPFGAKVRDWRRHKNLTLQQQAKVLGVTPAYLSALETGMRGRPSAVFVDQICVWLELIWDEAEELQHLASMSHPKPTINTRGSHSEAIYLANFVSQNIARLSPANCQRVTNLISDCLNPSDDEIIKKSYEPKQKTD